MTAAAEGAAGAAVAAASTLTSLASFPSAPPAIAIAFLGIGVLPSIVCWEAHVSSLHIAPAAARARLQETAAAVAGPDASCSDDLRCGCGSALLFCRLVEWKIRLSRCRKLRSLASAVPASITQNCEEGRVGWVVFRVCLDTDREPARRQQPRRTHIAQAKLRHQAISFYWRCSAEPAVGTVISDATPCARRLPLLPLIIPLGVFALHLEAARRAIVRSL